MQLQYTLAQEVIRVTQLHDLQSQLHNTMFVCGSQNFWEDLDLEFVTADLAYKNARILHEKAEAGQNTARKLCANAAYVKGFAKGYTKGYATGNASSRSHLSPLSKRKRLHEQSWEEKMDLAKPALMEEFDVDDWEKQWEDADGRWCSRDGPQEPGPRHDSTTEDEEVEPELRHMSSTERRAYRRREMVAAKELKKQRIMEAEEKRSQEEWQRVNKGKGTSLLNNDIAEYSSYEGPLRFNEWRQQRLAEAKAPDPLSSRLFAF